jgi:hypothetical protein
LKTISALVLSGAREASRQISILPFDLQGTLRRLKPHKRLEQLTRRADSELAWASDEPLIGGALILDTSVYLDVLQRRTPEAVDDLLTYRVCHHSAVCLAELTHVFGRLDPAHPSTSGVLQTLRDVIEDIPRHRLQAPDSAMWGEAGMLAGELFRLSGAPKGAGHEYRCQRVDRECRRLRLPEPTCFGSSDHSVSAAVSQCPQAAQKIPGGARIPGSEGLETPTAGAYRISYRRRGRRGPYG